MKRREFIKTSALVAASLGVAPMAATAGNVAAALPEDKRGRLIDSPPVLQNFAETSVGVAFSVTALANGFVIYGESPDLSDGIKRYCGGFRQTDMNDEVMLVRLTSLKPATTYYYKIGADRIHFGGGYDMKTVNTETDDTIYSFRTAGEKAEPRFCVINDTHANMTAFSAAVEKIAELSPSCVVWNGDACNTEETVYAQKSIFLKPDIRRRDYAARTPYIFCPGNHDGRGRANRHLERVWMYRQPEERLSRDWDLGRNFALRLGDIAMVGLDTGEDKQDTNPQFANLYVSGPYRQAQTAWLADTLKRKDIASAPYLVAFCHIPLFDDVADHNPGDVKPDDNDPRYTDAYAYWQRDCLKMWGPLLDKARCQLLITAHMHQYRYFPTVEGHRWAQIVGGGNDMSKEDSGKFPTVVEGAVSDGRLRIKVHNLLTGRVLEEMDFRPR